MRGTWKESYLLPAFSVYLVWVMATWLLEGRISTLLRPEAVADRILYTVVANILIGTVLALAVLRNPGAERAGQTETEGFRPLWRTIPAGAAGFLLGLILFLLQKPATTDPVILLNIYAQVLTVTIAEVAVCWVLAGSAVERLLSGRGRTAAAAGAILIPGVLFGIYHFAHSAPFSQPAIVAFLTVIGILTGLVYVVGRDVYATILFHNFLGCTGVASSLATAGLLDTYSRPLLPVIGMAVLALGVFIAMDLLYMRKVRLPGHRPGYR